MMKLKKQAILHMEGMLDKKEEKEFKRKLKDRPDIKEFMDNYRWIDEGLSLYLSNQTDQEPDSEEDEIDKMVQRDLDKYLYNYTKPISDEEILFREKMKRYMAQKKRFPYMDMGLILNIAATVAFIILLISAFIHFSGTQKTKKFQEEMLATYFKPFDDPFLHSIDSELIIPGKTTDTPGEDFLIDSDIVLRDGKTKPEDVLLISISLMQKKEFKMASQYLEGLAESPKLSLSEASQWYFSLSKIGEGEVERAKSELQELCSKSSLYSDKSCKLLELLGEMN